MVRSGFTLVEVIVSLLLVAVGALGLAAAAAVAQRALLGAELHERAVREAAALLDSLAFSGAAGSGTRVRGGIALHWDAPAAPAPASVEVRYAAGRAVVLRFSAARLPDLPARIP